jgi:hypothetical protein
VHLSNGSTRRAGRRGGRPPRYRPRTQASCGLAPSCVLAALRRQGIKSLFRHPGSSSRDRRPRPPSRTQTREGRHPAQASRAEQYNSDSISPLLVVLFARFTRANDPLRRSTSKKPPLERGGSCPTARSTLSFPSDTPDKPGNQRRLRNRAPDASTRQKRVPSPAVTGISFSPPHSGHYFPASVLTPLRSLPSPLSDRVPQMVQAPAPPLPTGPGAVAS